jgi:excisionase family DNA binding protein
MKEMTQDGNGPTVTPMLFPYEPEQFWQRVRLIVREEISRIESPAPAEPLYETPGLESKPLYKIAEVCRLFQVSKPTIYEWMRHGKLKPLKIRSRVFFLWQDIQKLLSVPPADSGKEK